MGKINAKEGSPMKAATFRGWIKRLAARGGIIVFFIMAFEVMIMISPFAFFFYSVFNPIFHWLDAYSMTRWLTHFFLPHMILPPTLPLKIIRVSGSVLFVIGCTTFIVCALQVYLGKIFKWGIASRGIYRFVRHPQYTSLGIWGVGMAILWPRFIVLVTLSIMFILYYFLARDEEKRMEAAYGKSYRQYMDRTGMFFPFINRSQSTFTVPTRPLNRKAIFVQLFVVAIVIGAGFVLRFLTLHSLQINAKGNITLVSIMPEDGAKALTVLNDLRSGRLKFLNNGKAYLGYLMPVDYIMQGMIANTGGESHLYKQHHTVGLIIDWVLHPFAHLRRSPAAQMAQMRHVDPVTARRQHCPLGINNQNMDCEHCDYRRIVFVEVDNPDGDPISGSEMFAFNAKRKPVGFIDIDTKTGVVIDEQSVDSKTAWSDVPTPSI
jgi:protein-S-isoprenylcysteine O-methyltransferase Ste14